MELSVTVSGFVLAIGLRLRLRLRLLHSCQLVSCPRVFVVYCNNLVLEGEFFSNVCSRDRVKAWD